jgi:hypothetical protein
MRREEREEAEMREAEAEDREEEAAQREAALELERERLKQEQASLKQEQAQERERIEHAQTQERQRQQAEQQLAAFHCRWQEKAGEALSTWEYRWLSASQSKEVLDSLETEIDKRQPLDEPRMAAIIARSLQALVEPLKTARDTQETRERLIKRALWNLPYSAADEEKTRAAAAVREALRRCDPRADQEEMQAAAEAAMQPVLRTIKRRMLEARLLDWAESQLPSGRSDRDQARVRRECAEILAELPINTSEIEAKEALEPTLQEACQEIKQRQSEKERQTRKTNLIQQGVAEVWSYLLELKREGEIAAEELWDSELTTDLKEAVQRGLESELSGDENSKEIRELTRQIIDGELQ